jgi:hypothetical protein
MSEAEGCRYQAPRFKVANTSVAAKPCDEESVGLDREWLHRQVVFPEFQAAQLLESFCFPRGVHIHKIRAAGRLAWRFVSPPPRLSPT